MKKLLFIGLIVFANFSSFAGFVWNTEELSQALGYENYTDIEELSSEENWAILAYGFTDETDYQDINGYLRFGEDFDLYNQTVSSVTKLIDDLYSAANKLPQIPKGLTVYRGFKLNWRDGECFHAGEVIRDKAFTSTTLSQKVARHFAFKINAGKGAFLILELASDQDGILITENNEHEVLLMPDRKITIKDSYEENGECFATGYLE